MLQKSSFLKNTLDLIETDPEIKSYIYQQILDFNPFVTPDTLVMVIARDPKATYSKLTAEQKTAFDHLQEESYEDEIFEAEEDDEISEDLTKLKFRIAIILKDGENSIEAEAFDNDIFNAIRIAKEALIKKLVEIQEEVESPQDRMMAIQLASENKPIH
jgi:hypothetical protein